MDITYTPFFRDYNLDEDISIKNPISNILGYTPKYNLNTKQKTTEEKQEQVNSPEESVTQSSSTTSSVPVETPVETPAEKPIKTPDYSGDKFNIFKAAYEKSKGDPNKFNFFAKLAQKESGFNADIQNQAGAPAFGYFQFMQGTKDNKSWNNIKTFAGVDTTTFRKSPEIQIKAAHKLADTFLKEFTQKDKDTAKKLGYSDSALIAGAWLAGVGGVRKLLYDGVSVDDKHWSKTGKGTDVKTRMDEFNNMFKKGGIIKFQEGGILEGKQWVKNWLFNRKNKLKQNAQTNYSYVPITSNFIYNNAVRNMDLTTASVNPTEVPLNADGVHFPGSRKIYLRQNSPSVAVHEWTHSTRPTIQSDTIDKIKSKLENNIYDQKSIVPDNYLDSSNEIYSRLMQLRHAYNMDPKHEYTTEEINELKRKNISNQTMTTPYKNKKGFVTTTFDKNGKVINSENQEYQLNPSESVYNINYDLKNTHNILNRYNTQFIKHLLNDVAVNKKEQILHAQKGVKIPTFADYYNDPNLNKKPSEFDVEQFFPIVKELKKLSQPTIENLADFTKAYETFEPRTYKLATKNKDTGKITYQDLVGYGFADKDLIEKYRNTDMSKEEADKIVLNKLNRIYEDFSNNTEWFNNLDENTKLALVDIAYNGHDVDEIYKRSDNLKAMLDAGITDPKQLIKEMDHSKKSDSWLGVRSAARRAMALGKYNWNPEKVDKYGRALDPNIKVGRKDWKASPYYKKY